MKLAISISWRYFILTYVPAFVMPPDALISPPLRNGLQFIIPYLNSRITVKTIRHQDQVSS